MAPDERQSVGWKEVERLYGEYLGRLAAGEDLDLEEFADDHPAHRDSLLELLRIDEFLSAARSSSADSLPERIRKRFGAHADPHVTLERESTGSPSDFSSEVLQRLAERHGAFGRYRIKGELARGGQGSVLRVWDEDLRRSLAMKVILVDGNGRKDGATPEVDSRTLARFLEEAQITGQLDHPGVVPVHELGLDSHGRVYFTMKLVKGEDFKSIIEKVHHGEDGWTLTRAVAVLLKICEAMAYAHSKGVIHRDLKPGNVMVGPFGEVYVMDWGLARVIGQADSKDIRIRPGPQIASVSDVRSERRAHADEMPDSPLATMDGDVVGTPAYMSPEQARGALDRVGPRSDVYSVSAMLYHLLAGHMPYVPPGARLNNYAVWQRVQEGPPRRLAEAAPNAPRELVAICEKAMSREASERYAGMDELAEELRAFMEHRVVRAHGSGPSNRLAKFVERNPVLVGTALVAVVLLVSSAVVFSLHLARAVVAKERAMRERSRDTFGPRIESLIRQEARLYPLVPDTVPAMRDWLGAALELLGEAEELPKSEKTVELVALLNGVRQRVVERMESASSLRERTIVRPAAGWAQAIEAIALSDAYARAFDRALTIEPQLGLEPSRMDPESGLWEFWLPLTGAAPSEIDRLTGRLVVGERTGIVLVLLPGSPHHVMGAGDPERSDEGCPVQLHPFFIGKHEVTQGQWSSVMEENPSYFVGGREHSDDGRHYEHFDLSHPVNGVTWYEATEFCRRLALALPTEAQWEYACRAGTETPYWFGDSPAAVERFENVAGPPWQWTAPVGSLEPNGFGLHDFLGNVAEFCRDRFVLGLGPSRLDGTDGSRTWGGEEEASALRAGVARWSLRGGSWYGLWSAYQRTSQPPDDRSEDQGFRVVRPLLPCPLCTSEER